MNQKDLEYLEWLEDKLPEISSEESPGPTFWQAAVAAVVGYTILVLILVVPWAVIAGIIYGIVALVRLLS